MGARSAGVVQAELIARLDGYRVGGVNVLTLPPGIGLGSVSASNPTTGKFTPLGGPVTSSSTGAPAGPKLVLHEEISPPPAGTV